MSSLLEKIRANKAAGAGGENRPPSQQIAAGDISLRGTGLTKREAVKNVREYERQVKGFVKADKSALVADAEKDFNDSVEATIEAMREAQRKSKIVLDESQLRAVAGIIHNRVSVLIGAAGTGKTTVTKIILQELAKIAKIVNLADVTWVYAKRAGEEKPVRILLREALKENMLVEGVDKSAAQEMPGIALAAYTGRATQQIKRAIPPEWHKNTSTIHALLGYAPVFEEMEYEDKITGEVGYKEVRRFRPSFDASMKLPFTFYVLDEGSMIPIPLFNELVDAMPEGARVLIIGDIHQLPPVYGKSVLGYALRKWPVFELTTIHRQAAGNAIIANAHRCLQGKPLENAENFHMIGNTAKNAAPTGSSELQKYVVTMVKKLHEMNRYDPYKDAIIVPQNKGLVGCDELNAHFVTMFNPEIKENGIVINKRINIHTGTAHTYFAVRDKIMITSNINTCDPPITNGMIGIVENININGRYDQKRSQVDFDADANEDVNLDLDNLNFALDSITGDEKEDKKDDETEDQRQSSHVMTIKFENGQTLNCSTAGDYRRVKHGYVATCHKSQGGEYPNIIILCHSVNAVMLSQEWLYTAITRARNNVYILGNQRGIDQALKRQHIKGYTLQDKIKSYIIETKSDDNMEFDKMKYPVLFEPKEV